jgi:Flp pilus assembly protein TadD
MNRSSMTGRIAPRLALAATTALVGMAMISISAEAAPRAAEAFESAQTALAKGQVEKAIRHAETAVMAEPRNPGFRALLGAAYLESGRFDSAATSFGDALDLGDENPRTVLSFALAKIALGESRAAIGVLDEFAQVIDPADLGLALALAGQPERGVHTLINAVRSTDAPTPKLRQNLAYAYALAGNWRAARVMAAEDVPADQLEARLGQWAAVSAPEMFQQRIASLLDVTPRADGGQPEQLALANFTGAAAMVAEAPTEAPAEWAAVAPAAAPAAADAVQAVPALAAAPAATVAEAFATPAPAVAAAAPTASGVRFVSNPVVQQLPGSAMPAARPAAPAPARAMAAPRIAAAPAPSSQRRMVAAPQPSGASDKAAATHLVQLGSYVSKAEAQRGWTAMKARFPALGGHTPVFTEAVVNGRTFWRVAAEGFGPKSAKAMCGTVKSAGRGCFAYAASSPPAGAVKRDVQMASRAR